MSLLRRHEAQRCLAEADAHHRHAYGDDLAEGIRTSRAQGQADADLALLVGLQRR